MKKFFLSGCGLSQIPDEKGTPAQASAQGDHILITERGRSAYLTVVLRGEEPHGLRERLRAEVRRFEEANRVVLANAGIVENLRGGDELLTSLIGEPE